MVSFHEWQGRASNVKNLSPIEAAPNTVDVTRLAEAMGGTITIISTCRAAGMDQFVSKPFKRSELAAALALFATR